VSKNSEFIVDELWTMAWAASVQHAKVYEPGIKRDSKPVRDFRRDVATYVATELLPTYKSPCDEAQHYANIDALIAHASKVGASVLPTHAYKFGVAQKLLNLCLKYHWCLGRIEEPPHCPVDRIVIDKTSFRGKLNWTDIRSREKYAAVIADIAQLATAEGLSIAEWELRNYRRR
jgi:hypothetical protein